METLTFKTNINCSSCVAKVTPHLKEEKGILNWKVDTANPQKILTVETDTLSGEEVIQIIKKSGYTAHKI
jgi:copper chaperone